MGKQLSSSQARKRVAPRKVTHLSLHLPSLRPPHLSPMGFSLTLLCENPDRFNLEKYMNHELYMHKAAFSWYNFMKL